MAHPQHNFTSNFNGSEGHNAELTLNINGTEHKYTPAGNDKEFTVTGAVRIDVNLDGSELVERITTVLNGGSLPLLVQQNLDGTEDSYTYVGLQDNEWLFGRVTTTNIDSVGINTTDGSVRRETLALASDVAIVSNTDPAVYTKLRTAVALGHLPVLDYQGTYATYVTIDNNILKFATEAADPNVESYVYTVASDNTVTATPRNAGVVRADSEDSDPGTLIDKLEVVDNVCDPEDPDDRPMLSLETTVDGQGNHKVAINEDNLRTFTDNVTNIVFDVIDTLDSMDFDEVPHAYLGSSLFQSSGDPASTGTPIDVFNCTSPLVGDCFEFEQTTTIDGVPFGHIWLEPGTYVINASVKCQWVGVPRGTFMNKVGLVMGENFDFSQEQELLRSTTRIQTIPARAKLTINVTHDAGTPVMGFWIQSMQVVKLAGGMSQTNVSHDSTLTGQGSVADPLGVDETKVAQSTLAGSLAPAFVPNSTNAIAGMPYVYDGKLYVAKEDYSGAWDSSKFEGLPVSAICLKSLPNIQNTSVYSSFDNLPKNSVCLISTTLTNKPKNGAGVCFTYGAEDTNYMLTQLFFSTASTFFVRKLFNGTWSDWTEIPTLVDGESNYKQLKNIDNLSSITDFNDVPVGTVSMISKVLSNAPTNNNSGILYCASAGNSSYIISQLYFSTKHNVFVRDRNNGVWSDWLQIPTFTAGSENYVKQLKNIDNTSSITDFNDVPVGTISLISKALSNAPANNNSGILCCFSSGSTSVYESQLYFSTKNNVFFRNKNNNVWGDWGQLFVGEPYKERLALSMFQSLAVIGDSFASGYVFTDSEHYTLNYAKSWPQQLGRKFGMTVKNFSYGGAWFGTWMSNSTYGLPALLADETYELYVIAMGINDSDSVHYVDLGTTADCTNDPENNPNTFYGNLAHTVWAIQNKNSKARIILAQLIGTSQRVRDHRDAIAYVADLYGVPCMDLMDADYANDPLYTSMIGSHPTALGISCMAASISKLIEKTMADNSSYFETFNGVS